MKIRSTRIFEVVMIFSLLASVFISDNLTVKAVQGNSDASLTSVIYDQGVDEDGDGKFEALDIGVEVNVNKAAYYGIELRGLIASDSNFMDITPEILLEPHEPGINVIHVRISGQWIYSYRLNPVKVSSISIRDLFNGTYTNLMQALLSREYSYKEFNAPGATLTGVVNDEGIDENGDGKFDFLKIGVELNVTSAGLYRLSASGFISKNFGYSPGNETMVEPGVHSVSIRVEGDMFHYTKRNTTTLDWVILLDGNGNVIQRIRDITLSRRYVYTDFDPPKISLTGKITDKGVDLDGDGTFDQMEIGVEVNVTESGQYYVSASGFMGEAGGSPYVWGSASVTIDSGVQVVLVSLDGPTIYAFKINPIRVSEITCSAERGLTQQLDDVSLSRKYLYTEFDEPQVAVGDWAKYSMNATWYSSDPSAVEPAKVKEQKQVLWMKIEIQKVTNVITISQIIRYRNGTENKLQPTTGDPKHSFLMYIVPSDLEKGDSIPGGYMPFNPVDEVEGVYAGMKRSLTYANLTMSFFGMNATMKMYWDRSTGILCEMNTTTSMRVGSNVSTQSISTKITETNLWRARGGIDVTALDSSGKPIVGANVSSTSTPSGQNALSGVSGSDGSITFSDIAVGNYTLQASMNGYLANLGSVNVVSGNVVALSITLQNKPTGGTSSGGIPGYSYGEIMVGVILGITILIWLRRRV